MGAVKRRNRDSAPSGGVETKTLRISMKVELHIKKAKNFAKYTSKPCQIRLRAICEGCTRMHYIVQSDDTFAVKRAI
jgi:hypothetical protein